jgi:hypothetical protein
MARSVDEILTNMDQQQAAETELASLNSPSQSAIYKLWKYITALVINLHEQLWDKKKIELEDVAKYAAVGSDLWYQKKILEFQYSATVPQVVTLDTTATSPTFMSVGYATIDESLRIITRASVKTAANKTVNVKVAKSDPPVALSAPELSALTTYLTNGGDGTNEGVGIAFAGVQMNVTSIASDKFFLEGTITYDGQYASVIQTKVIEAIEEYFANLAFDGTLYIIKIVDAIQAVPGVIDVKIVNAAIRANATAFSSKTFLIQSSLSIITSYPTFAGYVEQETTASQTFADKLTFTPA